MKKWKVYGIIATILLVLSILAFGLYYLLFRESISELEAKNIAYDYAGVEASNVTILTITKDKDDREYEIKFYDDLYEYEVDINYINGRVNNFEKDLRDDVKYTENNTINMTEDAAKNIVLQRIGKTRDEVTFTKVRIDRENGVTVYKVDLYDNEKEYELSIDVETKEIVSYMEDYLILDGNSATTSNYIGSEKAREIVLNHAGLSSNSVKFSKIELDVDYHIATYELEFYYNYYEYDYEINAVTGEILKYEKEK